MAVKIRLARGGAKKRPYYRVVVADIRAPRDGAFIEKIGTYNPMLAKDDKDRINLKSERVQYWLDQGALPTDRVITFMQKLGIKLPAHIEKKAKIKEASRVQKPSKKAQKEAESN